MVKVEDALNCVDIQIITFGQKNKNRLQKGSVKGFRHLKNKQIKGF
jgi:hypothetical protein